MGWPPPAGSVVATELGLRLPARCDLLQNPHDLLLAELRFLHDCLQFEPEDYFFDVFNFGGQTNTATDSDPVGWYLPYYPH